MVKVAVCCMETFTTKWQRHREWVGYPSLSNYREHGNVLSSPSGVRREALAKNEFGAFYLPQNPSDGSNIKSFYQ